jgi:hypothetical protein
MLGIVLVIAVTSNMVVTPARVAFADGAWIDAPLQNWNKPGQPVPVPAHAVNRAEIDPRCLTTTRPPDTLEDTQVEHQGWLLVGSYSGGWGTRIVQATSAFDGMCRPNSFQAFVFYLGIYAGSLSPQ